ncbi:MAG: hypothetical protein WCW93_02670 [Candidatus Paceibacterota bacterium]
MRLRKLIILFSFFFFISAFFIFTPRVFATTFVADDILENTTWGLAGSPYVIQDDIMVNSGVILTIEPGVIVKVAPRDGGINVLGTLFAEGTSDDHIYFTSLWDDSIGGDTNGDGNTTVPIVSQWNSKGLWYGCNFYFPEGVHLKNVDVSFSTQGLNFWATDASISNFRGRNNKVDLSIKANSNINLSGGDFFGGLYGAIQLMESSLIADNLQIEGVQQYEAIETEVSDLTLTDSTIQNLKNRTEAIGTEGPGIINFERVNLKNANNIVGYTGIEFNLKDSVLDSSYILTWGESTFNIDNSVIKNYHGHAIEDFNEGDTFNITKSKIINNDYGIYLYKDTNGFPPSVFNISDTVISGNSQYGVYGLASYPIDFKNVWWGDTSGPYHDTLNPTGLGNAVSDNVLFDPWCKYENCKAGFSNVLFYLVSKQVGCIHKEYWVRTDCGNRM